MPEASVGRRLVFTLLAALIVLAVIEVAAAVVWHAAFSERTQSAILDLTGQSRQLATMRPNAFWHHDLNPDHPMYRGELARFGTRGDGFPSSKPAGELRIVCAGNSTVEGLGVGPGETFPFYLEEILGEAGPPAGFEAVRVINAGISSHNSAFTLAYLAHRLIHFDPDIVVVKSGYNDYVPYIVPGMELDYTHVFPEPFTLTAEHGLYWRLAGRSHALRVVGRWLLAGDLAIPFASFSGQMTGAQFEAMDAAPNASRFGVFAENIRSMALLCKGRGIVPMLVDLPTSPDTSHFAPNGGFGERYRELVVRFEAELERVAAEENVAFVRTEPLESSDFIDHCHNSAAGHRKIAARIAALISAAAIETTAAGS